MWDYTLFAGSVHAVADSAAAVELLSSAAAGLAIPEDELESQPAERQRLIQQVARLSRARGFRRMVLNAYESRCAVTRMQLRIIEAAHIVPVPDPKSNDDVQNGIALSPTYHRAFDSGLVYLDEDFHFKVNRNKEAELASLKLVDGLPDLALAMSKRIHLPADRRQWPTTAIIRAAKKSRSIA